jgi:hypothetical protein
LKKVDGVDGFLYVIFVEFVLEIDIIERLRDLSSKKEILLDYNELSKQYLQIFVEIFINVL